MPRPTLEYPKEPRNTVNRYRHQAVYDLLTVHSIINTSPVLHVSFTPPPPATSSPSEGSPYPPHPFPTILPMIGHLGSFSRPSASLAEPLDLYLHGYVSSRLMNTARSSGGPGLPVCIAASKVDGLVLTLTPNSHNYNYRSAVLYGYATLVTDVDEKLWAMELVTNSVVADRWRHSRVPPTKAEMSSTQILKVQIESASSKVRRGVPGGDSLEDLGNDGLMGSVWTGVVPVYETLGEPIDGPYNRVKEVPEHVKEYVRSVNEENIGYALEAAKVEAPKKLKEQEVEDEEAEKMRL